MLRGVTSFVGRSMLCAIFIVSVLMNMIPRFDAVIERMTAQGIPEPKLMLVGAIILVLLGCLLVLTGIAARMGALMLLIFLAAATIYFHDFWKIPNSTDVVQQAADLTSADVRMNELIHFMKNVAIGGALVMILSRGVAWREELDDGYLD